MPKIKKITLGKAKDSNEKDIAHNDTNGPVYLRKGNKIIMKIHSKPQESAVTGSQTLDNTNECQDISHEAVGIQIGAPPLDGDANKELILYLAEILNLRKSDPTKSR